MPWAGLSVQGAQVHASGLGVQGAQVCDTGVSILGKLVARPDLLRCTGAQVGMFKVDRYLA